MKPIIIILGGLTTAVNLLSAYILSAFNWHAAYASSVGIVVQMVLLLLVSVIKMKDAFRYSLNFLFILLTAVQYVALLHVPETGFDSIYFVIAAGVVLMQLLLLLIVYRISKIN